MVERFLVSTPGGTSAIERLEPHLKSYPGQSATGFLASFWYFRGFEFEGVSLETPLIADSGAFSAYTLGGKIKVSEYAAWLDTYADRFLFSFNLDVIGDAEGSYRQWLQLREYGHLTMPVIHYGDDPSKVLPKYLSHGSLDRLAIGGGAMKILGQSTLLKWQAHVIKWCKAKTPETLLHGLGIHMRSRLARLPWDTTDSSAYAAAWRFGRLSLWRPTVNRWVSVELDGRQIYRYGKDVRCFGVDPGQVSTSSVSTYKDLSRLVIHMECRAAEDFNGRLRNGK